MRAFFLCLVALCLLGFDCSSSSSDSNRVTRRNPCDIARTKNPCPPPVEAIPEPGALVLFGLGVVLLGVAWRRK